MTAGLGPATSPRTVRVGDEYAHRRIALHRARQDDAGLRGALREAEVSLSSAATALYTSAGPDDLEEARKRAHAAYELVIAARADVAICSAAIERLGGGR